MKLFTIGYTKKTAREFFELLKQNQIQQLVDIRLKNSSQLAGFSKKEDLEFFLSELLGIEYLHMPSLAPSEELLKKYQKDKDWRNYEEKFLDNLNKLSLSNIKNLIEYKKTVLLCSEETADKCHRRLVAEFLKKEFFPNLQIIHL